MILVIYAHPYPSRSRACAALLAGIASLQEIEVRSLYDLYPDFDIDVQAEQRALERATVVVLLHPLYWYSVPSLLKHWFDQVLLTDFAHGDGRSLLEGKALLWATTTGRGEYGPQGVHRHPFAAFAAPIEMTARYCGMRWLEPFVVHGVDALAGEALGQAAERLRERLASIPAGAVA